MGEMDPHVFAVAEEAFRRMTRYICTSCMYIIIVCACVCSGLYFRVVSPYQLSYLGGNIIVCTHCGFKSHLRQLLTDNCAFACVYIVKI